MIELQSLARGISLRMKFSSAEARRAFLRGRKAMQDKDWAAAANAYADAVVGAPAWPALWVQYGHALKESGRREEAERAYRKALSIEPDRADTHLQLGHVLKLMGRLDDAVLAYLRAVELDPAVPDALREVDALAKMGANLPVERLMAATMALYEADDEIAEPVEAEQDLLESTLSTIERLRGAGLADSRESEMLQTLVEKLRAQIDAVDATAAEGALTLVFDVADLISYFKNARLPTGIQRVQIEVVSSLLKSGDPSRAVRVCSFSEHLDDWVEIPARMFLRVCELALKSGDREAADWVNVMRRLDLLMLTAKPIGFPEGSCLVNLGTSWWLQNYFMNIRKAKREHNISYVPFVHDLIPIMTPEHCIRELTQDFITWILGVFQHADMFLANSEATKRDLLAVAATLGHDVDPSSVAVVRLDADFRRPGGGTASESLLSQWRLRPNEFVLMVSTVESRKNHIGAFSAWLSLIRKHGAAAIPTLVCVGNAGWLNDAVHAKLASSELLRGKVKMLSRLSDDELASLYRHSLFTLYPSHYEGWGLPVTESLCYGKATLVSDASSLPEAGGIFADYFQAGSDSDLAAGAETLIFDREHRLRRERLIIDEFKPRPWAEVGAQIGRIVAGLHQAQEDDAEPRPLKAVGPMPAKLGVFYPLTRNLEVKIWSGLVPGEIYRSGSGWWWPDDWGAWTKPGGGELSIRIDGRHGPLRAYFRLRGVIQSRTDWTFDLSTDEVTRKLQGNLGPDERKWVTVDLPGSDGGSAIHVTLKSDQMQHLAEITGGLDQRVTGMGVAGFCIAEIGDLPTRLAIAEAIACDELGPLTPGYANRPY